jgi:3-methyl-2-oxobutanoate hydroxymethyltransferase
MAATEKTTIRTLWDKAQRGERFSTLALYDYPFALLAQQAGIDAIIVGDSAAMVNYGHPNTLQADMDMMIRHTASVRRGAPNLFIIGDMPFMSYQPGIETAIKNAGRFIVEGGADAVKVEGGTAVVETVRALVKAGIPVVGHVGLIPQTAAIAGSFKAQGREADAALEIVRQAKELEAAGICLLVLECVPAAVAEAVTKTIAVPVIGIGGGPACHGQVLVLFDILGISPQKPAKFVHRYAELSNPIAEAMKRYAADVRQGQYPAPEHCYKMKPGEEEIFTKRLEE